MTKPAEAAAPAERSDTGCIGQEVADGEVAARFSWLMRASCSPWGLLCDAGLVGALTALFVVVTVVLHQVGEPSARLSQALLGLCLLPLTAAVLVSIGLAGQRKRVVSWLGQLPFVVANLNSVLNGLGETLELEFVGDPPSSPMLNARLERVDEHCFVLDFDASAQVLAVRIGIVDSKWLPAYSNYRRWQRVKTLVEEVLLSVHQEHALKQVRVG